MPDTPATLPSHGFVRIKTVLNVIPVGRTTWYNGIKKGIYPAPVILFKSIRAWSVNDIKKLIQRIEEKRKDSL